MDFQLDEASNQPIYVQIMEHVKHLVATGRLKAGDQLPTVRQLAVDLRVNPNTIARAYTELANNGVISTQQGRGTFITGPPDHSAITRMRADRLRAMMGQVALDVLSLGYQPAEILEALQTELAVCATNHRS